MKKMILFFFIIFTIFSYSMELGANGALEDKNLTLKKMLQYALEDEYLAKNEYVMIMEKYGESRPFSNIKPSEDYHISLLLPLIKKYEVPEVNENEIKKAIVVPGSLAEAYKVGVEAEIKNIKMYDLFLKQELPEDVRTVFLELKSASQNHLNAFQRQVDRTK